jgi:hypothetical protein
LRGGLASSVGTAPPKYRGGAGWVPCSIGPTKTLLFFGVLALVFGVLAFGVSFAGVLAFLLIVLFLPN